MANRRMGGGPPRGNRSFSQHQQFQGNAPVPWGNSQNSMNPGLISQLTTNTQQLALALTSLLNTQQVSNPPSLLSLNMSPGFSNQDRDINRFGNRGLDFRRHEPYNKNRNGKSGWNSMDNNRNRNRGRRDGPIQNNRDRNRSKSNKNNENNNRKKREDKVKKPEEKIKKEENADMSVDENNEEDSSENKGDSKEEKNTGDDKNQESGDEDIDKKDKGNIYYDVPQKFLNCFVCNKEMWDGESMQKHIRGPAHKLMLNSLDESTNSTVKVLRENMRLQEEKKVIEINRMHRPKKFNKFKEVENHCNMCDLKFLGKILAHRKTEGHQRLKRYLHPKCNICKKEFHSRTEWVEHCLTPNHLRTLNTKIENIFSMYTSGGKDGEIIINEEELDIEPPLGEPLQMEVEHPILELTEDFSGLPAYKKDRKVSTQSLKPFSGFVCELCNRGFVTEELAQEHLSTRRHYYAFIEAAKKKLQKQEDDKKKEDEEKKEQDKEIKDKEETEDMCDTEEACNEDDDEEEEEDNLEENGAEENLEANVPELEEEVPELEEEVPELEEEVPKMEEEVPVLEEEVPELEEEVPVPVKVPEKVSPARPLRKGVAKNGAGPKSKKARKL